MFSSYSHTDLGMAIVSMLMENCETRMQKLLLLPSYHTLIREIQLPQHKHNATEGGEKCIRENL